MALIDRDEYLANLYRMEQDAVTLLRDAENGDDKEQAKQCKKLLATVRQTIRASGGKPIA